ncbi:hypothetical protein CHCC15337_3762 [Bacillus paralicheniformis]|nr:hypothetical protein CHCC5021_3243 [Bacillus paralicheniformis]TWK64668.1 hypothetical protein CHCC20342_4630 [Bacillus licheniformis]TWL11317.1 hypothetical protein CHCC19468_2151 [Bacillus paralicheniformis]TWL20017.1 hypothetical protein CHCC19467_1520 [Bacillus paralicheniformis]TWL45994.1 hypothetical protein CHCC15337_3762 [Bacillus paralicheniformis]
MWESFISERRQLRASPIINIFCYCGNKFFLNQKKQAHMKSGAPFDMNLQFVGSA